MPLQFRRGHSDDLPLPSDAAVGEPLFTTNDGKLHIKKADGTFAEIGNGSSSEIDLSGLATGSLVKVNATQDGFDAATGGDLPSHTHSVANVTGLQDALDLKVDLDDLPQDENNVIDIARQSTLEDFIADFPVDGNGNLDIARESSLQDLSDRTITAGDGLTGGGDLSADRTLSVSFAGTGNATTVARSNHTHAATELTTSATTTGYLKWTYESGSGTWSVEAAVADAPAFINGGNALADVGN
jgi:hypothetical protein